MIGYPVHRGKLLEELSLMGIVSSFVKEEVHLQLLCDEYPVKTENNQIVMSVPVVPFATLFFLH